MPALSSWVCCLKTDMETKVQAYAKLNISLDVVSKRPDGYHNMAMVMESVSLCDDVTIRVKKGNGEVSVSTNRNYLPTGKNNSAGKAAELFLCAAGITDLDVDIELFKRIPVCAGMAGGSTDAAAVLRGLNKLLGTGFDRQTLEKMGENIGSDVPYCVAGGTVLATGRGELLEDLPDMPECSIVICKPSFPVSTPELFSRIKCDKIRCRPDTNGIIECLEKGDLVGIGRRAFNVFESVLGQGIAEVERIKGVMLDHGAVGASMSGTGPTVFGIYADSKDAEKAFEVLKDDYIECFIAENIKKLSV